MLSVAPLPEAGEHVSGWVRRLARANGLTSLRQLYAYVGYNGIYQSADERQWQLLAEATGLPIDVLAPMRLPSDTSGSAAPVQLNGLTLRSHQIGRQVFHHCPECLSEARTVPSAWFVHHVTACARHHLKLRDDCPACGRRLRIERLELDWRCGGCGHHLADSPSDPASEVELGFARLLGGDWSEGARGPLRPDLLAIGPEAALTAVERIGKLVLTAEADQPLGEGRGVHRHGKIDQLLENRATSESRAVVQAATTILSEWPHAYHELLTSLLDRAPYAAGREPNLRRLATDAGLLAMRPLRCSTGPVDYVERERVRWTEGAFGPVMSRRRVRTAGNRFADLKPYAMPERRGREDYMTPVSALRALGGGKSIAELSAWVEADVIEIDRDSEGGYLFPRASVERAIEALRAFPADDGRPGMVGVVSIARSLHPIYLRKDLLIDLAQGHVGAVLRYPDRSGLEALAIDLSDFERRHATANLATIALADGAVQLPYLNGILRKIWRGVTTMTTREAEYVVLPERIVVGTGRQGMGYTVREMIDFVQAHRPVRLVFHPVALFRDGIRDWRRLVIDEPRYTGVRELTS